MLAYLELGARRRLLGEAAETRGGVTFRPVGKRHRDRPGQLIELLEEADLLERAVLRAFPESHASYRAKVRLMRFEREAHDMPVIYLERVSEGEPISA